MNGTSLGRVFNQPRTRASINRGTNFFDLDSRFWHNAAMKRRFLILAAGLVAFVGLVLGVLAMLPPRIGVTKANFDRIEIGMTRAEVGEILGSLGSDKDSRHFYAEHKLLVRWEGDWVRMDAVFENGVVCDKSFYNEPLETFGEKMRYWFGLKRH
jgi:hypothetical protein